MYVKSRFYLCWFFEDFVLQQHTWIIIISCCLNAFRKTLSCIKSPNFHSHPFERYFFKIVLLFQWVGGWVGGWMDGWMGDISVIDQLLTMQILKFTKVS